MNALLLAIVIAAGHAPLNRSTYFDVNPQGKVGIVWQEGDGTKTYAQVGSPDKLSAPTLVAGPPFINGSAPRTKFNIAHNAPFIVALKDNFVAFTGAMNANGYAQGFGPPPTGFGYLLSEWWGAWAGVMMAPLANWVSGSSLTVTSTSVDRYGVIHMWGQGHLNGLQGGMGYQKLQKGSLYSKTLASAWYTPGGLNYFCEGTGIVSPKGLHHVAFGYNKQGDSPNYGLYYMRSKTDGSTWENAYGNPVSIPVKHSDQAAAIVGANLWPTTYTGDLKGASNIQVGEANDQPLIIKPIFTDDTYVQNWLYTFVNGRWLRVTVGPKLFWNTVGAGIYYNPKTDMVNIVLLDAGHVTKKARVLRFSQPLADLNNVSYKWTQDVIATIDQNSYASSLQVRQAQGKLYVMLESDYKNPGTVKPMMFVFPAK